ncbi:MAG: hypothetical protein ABSC38_06945 [Verrucomicrobiia bacterium]
MTLKNIARRTPNRRTIQQYYECLPEEIRTHFEHFPRTLDRELPLEVALSYLMYRVELAHRDTLYCGVVRLHHADSRTAKSIIRSQHLIRKDFREIFHNVFGRGIPDAIVERLKAAERIRDKAMHGSEPPESEMREAIVDVFDYAWTYNKFVVSLASFPPFGNLQGVLAGRERLTPVTTRWLMKGFGFAVK